jgi:hypothetical protein
MTTRKTALEQREDQRTKRTIYDHPTTEKFRADRDREPDASDALRRKQGEETGTRQARQHEERAALRHKHKVEIDRHYQTSRARPLEMEARHEEEVAEMTKRHRREIDRCPKPEKMPRRRAHRSNRGRSRS